MYLKETKQIILLAIPLIIGQLLQMSMGVVDTIMAGNLSSKDLAAVALGGSLFNPLIMLLGGMLFSVSPIISHNFGAKKFKEIGESVGQSLWIVITISLVSFIICQNLYHLCQFLQVDEEMIPLIKGYINAVSYGIPGLFLSFSLKSFFEGISFVRPIMAWSFIGLLFNILGNYTLVYGHFGFPQMGAVGTGWATAIVMWITFFGLFFTLLRSKHIKNLNITLTVSAPNKVIIGDILKIGIPIGVSLVMEIGIFALTGLLAGRFGADQLAAHQIALNVASITFMVPLGLSFAVSARVGQNVGAGNFPQVKIIGKISLMLSAFFMSLTAITFVLFRYSIISVYTSNQVVLEYATHLLLLAALFQVFDGIQVSGLGCLRGLKDTKIPMTINLISYWIIGIPISYYFGIIQNMGPKGLWSGLIAGLFLAAIFHNVRFFYRLNRKIRKSEA